ncbi:MAG: hypothetical protein DSM106950_21770 [Stigonema ocellatum SAG 48.90 = DSM 106950]|nr:hypothetical protein [Stigonema ocellatum SAG 48.90 = DSM 106950]
MQLKDFSFCLKRIMATKKNSSNATETPGIDDNEEKFLKDPQWVEKALKKATAIELNKYEEELANLLIELAFKNSKSNPSLLGHSLAAAFDLFVAAEFYKKITSKGWLYCPSSSPLLIYPFTNTCTRCILNGEFHFHKANKPGSGTIGGITRKLLGVFLARLFQRSGRSLTVLRGAEPIDLVVWDNENDIVLMAEAKAAPLTTLALAVPCEIQTALNDDGEVINLSHGPLDNSSLEKSEFHLLIPQPEGEKWSSELVSLGLRPSKQTDLWSYSQMARVFSQDEQMFGRYFEFWQRAFAAYSRGEWIRGAAPDPVYWLTNACGQPVPRPAYWPTRNSGEGFESVSDGKSSMGMDRTDDIKKGIYQVLKLGASRGLPRRKMSQPYYNK